MNEKIKSVEALLRKNSREQETLEKALYDAWYEHLETKGIKKGSIVNVLDSWGGRTIKGVFSSLTHQYGSMRPEIMKIKKDGKAHSSASVYCGSFSNILELR